MDRRNDELSYEQYSETSTKFLLPGEIALLTTKQHIFSVIPPIIIASILGTGAVLLSLIAGTYFRTSPLLTILTGSMLITLTLGLIVKILVDWYFHLYLVTNRRILEIAYKPFFSQDVNDVLLDQVRCTEIDVKIHGYIHGLMDVGDIIITFDRPTHQQEFVLHDIKSPRTHGTLLGHLLNTPKEPMNTQNIWYKEGGKTANYTFTQQLIPKRKMQIV